MLGYHPFMDRLTNFILEHKHQMDVVRIWMTSRTFTPIRTSLHPLLDLEHEATLLRKGIFGNVLGVQLCVKRTIPEGCAAPVWDNQSDDDFSPTWEPTQLFRLDQNDPITVVIPKTIIHPTRWERIDS